MEGEVILLKAPWADIIKLYVLSLLYGIAVLTLWFLQWIWWNHDSSHTPVRRHVPPTCLLDPTLGRHSFLKVMGTKMHVVTAGDPGRPLLLLLHGFPDCWFAWRDLIPVLSEHFRVVAVDLKGFGDSDKPTYIRAYCCDVLLDELSALITALEKSRQNTLSRFMIFPAEEPKCFLVGHSIGGLLGWLLTLSRPHLVEKFVSIAAPHPNLFWEYVTWKPSSTVRWTAAAQLPWLPELDALRGDVKCLGSLLPHLHPSRHRTVIDAYKFTFSRKEDWTGPFNYLRTLSQVRVHPEFQSSVPTLLVAGTRDPKVQLESMCRSAELADRAAVKVVEGAGHFPHHEYPEIVASILIQFLTDTRPSGGATRSRSIFSTLRGAVSSTVNYGNQVITYSVDTIRQRSAKAS